MVVDTSSVFIFGSNTKEKLILPTPNHTLNLEEEAYLVNWAPYDWCEDLLFLAFKSLLVTATCKIEDEEIEFKRLNEFGFDSRVSCMSWGPQTSLNVIPKVVQYCIGSKDFQIRLFETNLVNQHTCKILSPGHSDYINDISFSPNGKLIASVSDDQTCKLWLLNSTNQFDQEFCLNSPGVSVKWCTSDTNKLMVAEKHGTIRIYNVEAHLALQSIESLDYFYFADWAQFDSKKIVACTGEKVISWDLNNPARSSYMFNVSTEKGGIVKFNAKGEFVANLNLIAHNLKVIHMDSKKIIVNANLKLPLSLSWHFRLPILTIIDNQKLCFWKLNN